MVSSSVNALPKASARVQGNSWSPDEIALLRTKWIAEHASLPHASPPPSSELGKLVHSSLSKVFQLETEVETGRSVGKFDQLLGGMNELQKEAEGAPMLAIVVAFLVSICLTGACCLCCQRLWSRTGQHPQGRYKDVYPDGPYMYGRPMPYGGGDDGYVVEFHPPHSAMSEVSSASPAYPPQLPKQEATAAPRAPVAATAEPPPALENKPDALVAVATATVDNHATGTTANLLIL